jgi:ferritin-like metal-binding protein YciE
MQIPENPSNNDIRIALIQLREELEDKLEDLSEKVEKLDYKFDTYQKGTDGMVRMATTIIIATASVVVLSSLSPAITAIVTALSAHAQ